MKNNGPIIIIDDDKEDQEILLDVLVEMGVTRRCLAFNDGASALQYLKTTSDQPFVILCDINMPRMNGLECRAAIEHNDYLRKKSIPFIFLTTSANKLQVEQAYEMSVQGFFIKQTSIADMKLNLRDILNYWANCIHPNTAVYINQ